MSNRARLLSTPAKVNLLVLVVSAVFSWSSLSDRVPVSVGCSSQELHLQRAVQLLESLVGRQPHLIPL